MQRAIKKKITFHYPNFRVGVVVADFNAEMTAGLLRGTKRALKDSHISQRLIRVYHVAGSFEVAQLAMRLAKTGKFDALVCLGVIVRGETTHDHHLASAVTNGLMRVGQDTGVPVGLGVITVSNMVQARARTSANKYNRGYAAAAAAVSLAAVSRSL